MGDCWLYPLLGLVLSIGRSPSKGDALHLTFAYRATKHSDFPAAYGKQPNVTSEYAPRTYEYLIATIATISATNATNSDTPVSSNEAVLIIR
ncbi:TPA: hypothetical protein MH325_07170 [Klebsiella pneumoniae]|nr:hypothetical protein FCG84_012685 [Klebsiella pneumoniae]HBX4887753.1 hypothetical protein [Klebsiella pneumoniae]HBZ1093864.1 hypothetical protein [Klebsiella pneumoniae]